MIKRERLLEDKRRLTNDLSSFLGELAVTKGFDIESFLKCLQGLRAVILEEYKVFKDRELRVVLNSELDYIKKITQLLKDYRKNYNAIIEHINLFLKAYDKEVKRVKTILYS